jgi:hypothetical protein
MYLLKEPIMPNELYDHPDGLAYSLAIPNPNEEMDKTYLKDEFVSNFGEDALAACGDTTSGTGANNRDSEC